jgi:hypothetical protein
MRQLYLGIAFALGLIPAHLSAGIPYNNFGPGYTVSATSWVFFNAVGFAGTTFTTTGAGPLSTVLTNIDTPVPLTIGLYTNSAGQPGTLLESWTVPVTSGAQLITLTSVVNPVLSSGTPYWLVITVPPNITFFWAQNNQGVNGGYAAGASINALSNSTAAFPTPAIQIDTQNAPNGTPLPPTLILTLCGLALVGLSSFAVKRTFRVVAR